MKLSVEELATIVEGSVIGDGTRSIRCVSTLDDATGETLVYASSPSYFDKAVLSGAGCIIAGEDFAVEVASASVIACKDPESAYIKTLEAFMPEEHLPCEGVSASATVEPGARIAKGARIGAGCYVGKNVTIGENTVLFPGVYIAADVIIGSNCKFYPGVSIYERSEIADEVVLHSGVVIGSDGFGYHHADKQKIKYPHLGKVVIEEKVEIGANSVVDRAKVDATIIGSGTKIDNLVHIAHNCRIGKGCIIVAMTGIAGSSVIGDNVTLAAQVGVKDHVSVGADSVVAARAGIIGDIPAGSFISGFPARDHRDEMRMLAAMRRVPELMEKIRALEKRLDESGK